MLTYGYVEPLKIKAMKPRIHLYKIQSDAFFNKEIIILLIAFQILAVISLFATTESNVAHFTWDVDAITPISGPKAITNSSSVCISPDGKNGSYGLNAGKSGDDIELKIPNLNFDDGIYISVDFQRDEDDADFVSKNNDFKFGMSAGELFVLYHVKKGKGSHQVVYLSSGYIIPDDDNFRTYEFNYDPDLGVGTIAVDGNVVAQNTSDKFSPLKWGNGNEMYVGENANGEKSNKAIFDNLVINMKSMSNPVSNEFIYFEGHNLNNNTELKWATLSNINDNYFEIERSNDGVAFNTIGKINSTPNEHFSEYSFITSNKNRTPIYYRLKQVDNDNSVKYSNIITVENNTDLVNRKDVIIPTTNAAFLLDGINNNDVKQIILVNSNGNKINLSENIVNNAVIIPEIDAGNYMMVIQINSNFNTIPVAVK